MKKILITFLIAASAIQCFARKIYCTVKLEQENGGYVVYVDYGKHSSYLVDENNMPVVVRGTADLLNYMSKIGWEFIPTNKELIFFKEETSND